MSLRLNRFGKPTDPIFDPDLMRKFLDPYIAEWIIGLNAKNIKTYYSCSDLFEEHLQFKNAAEGEPILLNSAYVLIDLESINEYLAELATKLCHESSKGRWWSITITCAVDKKSCASFRIMNPFMDEFYFNTTKDHDTFVKDKWDFLFEVFNSIIP